MAHQIYNISFRWLKTATTAEKMAEVDANFGLIGDWLRFTASSYFVWTDKSSLDIYNAIRMSFHAEDNIIIILVNPLDYNGWAPPWVWEWFNKKRLPQTIDYLNPLAGLSPPQFRK